MNYRKLGLLVGMLSCGLLVVGGGLEFNHVTGVVKVIGGVDTLGSRANLLTVYTSANSGTITANSLTLADSNNTAKTVTSVSVVPDKSVAGPAVNGRDQAGAFSISSFIYGYVISNGTTTASTWSASATSPTLPSGYTYFALATIARLDAAGNILAYSGVGKTVHYYDSLPAILSGGNATTWTAVSLSSRVSPQSRNARFTLAFISNLEARLVHFGPDGVVGHAWMTNVTANTYGYTQFPCPITSSQQVYYKIDVADTTRSLYLYVCGYDWD